MLVVTANWGLADGTLVPDRRQRQAAWLTAVQRGILRGGFREDGGYHPVDRVEIVLAGDSFDWLTTLAWTEGMRPWHGGQRIGEARASVVARALRRGRLLVRGLARWCRDGVTVPGADRRHRPTFGTACRVSVQVTLLAGDRDRWIADYAGRVARHGIVVGDRWTDGLVVIRHGHDADPLCIAGECPASVGRERAPTLYESVAVDLVARFGRAVMEHADVRQAGLMLIPSLAGAGVLDLPDTLLGSIDRLERRGVIDARRLDVLASTWRRAVVAWRREAVRCQPANGLQADATDLVASLLDAAGESCVARTGRRTASVTAAAIESLGGRAARSHPSVPGRHREAWVFGHAIPGDDGPVGSSGKAVVVRLHGGPVCEGGGPATAVFRHDAGAVGWAWLCPTDKAAGVARAADAATESVFDAA